MSTRGSYSSEFRREAVRRLRAGTSSPRELAAELGCSVQTLQRWERQLGLDDRPPAPAVESAAERPDAPDAAQAAIPPAEPDAALHGVIAGEQVEPEPPAPGADATHAPVGVEQPSEPMGESGGQADAAPDHEEASDEAVSDHVPVGGEVDEAGAADPSAPEPDAPGAASSAPSVVDAVVRRWWVVVSVAVIAALAAWAYASTEPPRYQATTTVLAHPAVNVTKASDYTTDLSLLSYGSLEQTFVALARSSKLIDETTAALGLGRAAGDHYRAVANVLPSSTVLEISVDGPDREAVVPLANALGASVSKATRTYFPIFALTPLDAAVAPSSQIAPRTGQDVLFAGLAGLILGVGVALLSLRIAAFSRLRVEGLTWPARF